MQVLAYGANFLWVMVIGLLGPSLPAIVAGLGITYSQAGLFFTLLSLGSFFGTSLGAAASDRVPRRLLFALCASCLAAGLAALGLVRGYFSVALVIFLFSLLGSPVGAIGQSIVLGAWPGKRERNLSLMSSFGAMGSLLAPILVSVNYSVGLAWRWPFLETAGLALVLLVLAFLLRIPAAGIPRARVPARAILAHRRVLGVAVMIFLSIAIDLGFVYWLAEYFSAELAVDLRLASSVVGIYLAGIIAGRLSIPLVLKRLRPDVHLALTLCLALAAIVTFTLVPSPAAKAALCALYGLGVGPVFPLLMARGTREFPEQSGAVTGVLYGSMSLGGVVFPLLVGAIAQAIGIARSYWFCAAVALALLAAVAPGALRPRALGGPAAKVT